APGPAARAAPELAVAVVAPALDAPAGQQRAGLGAAGGDRGRMGDPAHRHRCRAARLAVAYPRAAAGADPELAVGIVTPAVDAPARQQRARVVAAGADRDRGRDPAHRHRRRCAWIAVA